MSAPTVTWHDAYDEMIHLSANWELVRGFGPVSFHERALHGVPAYVVTTRDDILAVLLDPETFERPMVSIPPRCRRVTEPLLAPHALGEMPQELQRRAAAVIEAARAMVVAGHEVTPADIGNAYAEEVFSALCGMQRDGDLARAVADRRTPFLAALADALGDAEAIVVVQYLVAAGLTGLARDVQFALVDLLNDAALCDQLRADPQRVAEFVDHHFRRRSAFPTIIRTTMRATTLAGVDIPKDARVELCIGALDRSPGHLEFGAGMHRCIGRHLSTLALRVFVGEWLGGEDPVDHRGRVAFS